MRMIAAFVLSTMWVSAAWADDQKVDRPGQAPPEGFVALFNGKDLSGWRGLGQDTNPYEIAKWTAEEKASKQKAADEDLARHWRVENGEIVNDGSGVYLTTAKDYRDFELRVNWRMMAANGDSGVYLRGSPQVQIWDPNNQSVRSLGADKGSASLGTTSTANPGGSRW